jgi:hypothetical protein
MVNALGMDATKTKNGEKQKQTQSCTMNIKPKRKNNGTYTYKSLAQALQKGWCILVIFHVNDIKAVQLESAGRCSLSREHAKD